jgi:hypothetical protein
MVTLARNLYFFRSRFFTRLTAVFVVRRRYALAWQVCTLALCSCHHHKVFLFQVSSFRTFGLKALRRNDGPASTLSISVALFTDDFFGVADPFLSFASVLFRFP